jgi:hypothetical protein
VNKVLIGNKCDVPEAEREVTKAEGEALAAEYNVAYFETSAKQNVGVSEAFGSITMDVVNRLSADPSGGAGGGGGAGKGGAGGKAAVGAQPAKPSSSCC